MHTQAHLSVHLGLPPLLCCCLCMYVVTTIIRISHLTFLLYTSRYFCTIGFVYETSFSLEPMTVFPHLLIIILCQVLFYMCTMWSEEYRFVQAIYFTYAGVYMGNTEPTHHTFCIIHFLPKLLLEYSFGNLSVFCYIVHAFSDRSVVDSFESLMSYDPLTH